MRVAKIRLFSLGNTILSLKRFFGFSLFSATICPRWHGLVVRAVAFEARGPGLNPAQDQRVFLLGHRR